MELPELIEKLSKARKLVQRYRRSARRRYSTALKADKAIAEALHSFINDNQHLFQRIRLNAKCTQQQIAEAANVPPQYISTVESGKTAGLNTDALLNIMEVYRMLM